MARTKRSAKLENRSARLRLAAGKMHQEPLAPGQYLAYRRSTKGGAGSWYARWYRDGKILQNRLGSADDFQEGAGTLTYAQAQTEAAAWFKGRIHDAKLAELGEVIPSGPYTVGDAMRDYLRDAERRGIKGLKITTQTTEAHILPALGGFEISRLTKKRIEDWHHALAELPRRKTGKKREEVEHLEAPRTEDEKRARKDSANRILTVLRAALNHALRNGKASEPAIWKRVEPFRNVGSSRVRFLSPEEQTRLLNACMPEFRNLVRAALFTGCRYGELTRLQVKDLDAKGGTVYVSESKSGKPRHVFLTEESVQWFTSLVAGKSPNAFILTREGVKRTKRKDFDTQWTDHDQKYYMALACEAARLEPIGFHELRHTYASALVNAGVPLAYVAAQLGHVDTKMVEKYYGHLCPSAMADAIRAAAPKFGLAASRVNPLKTKKA